MQAPSESPLLKAFQSLLKFNKNPKAVQHKPIEKKAEVEQVLPSSAAIQNEMPAQQDNIAKIHHREAALQAARLRLQESEVSVQQAIQIKEQALAHVKELRDELTQAEIEVQRSDESIIAAMNQVKLITFQVESAHLLQKFPSIQTLVPQVVLDQTDCLESTEEVVHHAFKNALVSLGFINGIIPPGAYASLLINKPFMNAMFSDKPNLTNNLSASAFLNFLSQSHHVGIRKQMLDHLNAKKEVTQQLTVLEYAHTKGDLTSQQALNGDEYSLVAAESLAQLSRIKGQTAHVFLIKINQIEESNSHWLTALYLQDQQGKRSWYLMDCHKNQRIYFSFIVNQIESILTMPEVNLLEVYKRHKSSCQVDFDSHFNPDGSLLSGKESDLIDRYIIPKDQLITLLTQFIDRVKFIQNLSFPESNKSMNESLLFEISEQRNILINQLDACFMLILDHTASRKEMAINLVVKEWYDSLRTDQFELARLTVLKLSLITNELMQSDRFILDIWLNSMDQLEVLLNQWASKADVFSTQLQDLRSISKEEEVISLFDQTETEHFLSAPLELLGREFSNSLPDTQKLIQRLEQMDMFEDKPRARPKVATMTANPDKKLGLGIGSFFLPELIQQPKPTFIRQNHPIEDDANPAKQVADGLSVFKYDLAKLSQSIASKKEKIAQKSAHVTVFRPKYPEIDADADGWTEVSPGCDPQDF